MKTIDKFIDEVSGKEFNTKKEAILSEQMSLDIKNSFNFYTKSKEHPKDGNDKIGVQRTEIFYYHLIDTLIKMIKKYEKWIAKHYGKKLTREYVKGCSMIGRFLEDGNSDLYKWWGIQGNICPKCFREYGQMYYAINCKCS